MRLPRVGRRRRGGAFVEATLVVTAFLALVVGGYRQHVLTQAARQAARQAMVHGQLAPASWNGGPWGPGAYGPAAANGSDPKSQAAAPYLAGMSPSNVQVSMAWPDGSNAP